MIQYNEVDMELEIFDPNRVYDDRDTELDMIASREKRAQWRHRRVGPNFLKFGRKVSYLGADLNAWVNHNRVTTQESA